MPQPVEGPIAEIALKEQDLGVNRLWGHFAEITQIPRKTGQEDRMASHAINWTKEHDLVFEEDPRGNLLILVPATEGLDKTPGVILQGHMDMVCVGEPDPASNPVTPVLSADGEWLQAQGTTLGADNGIGISTAMAIAEEQVPHGPLAIMLTRHEEQMIDGAMNMGFQNPLVNYRYLLNLDSEDAGEATISCAGGGDTLINLPINRKAIGDEKLITLSINGLLGGHSGVLIHEGRLNGVKVMGQVLDALTDQLSEVRIADIKAGVARNAIPKDVAVTIAIGRGGAEKVAGIIAKVKEEIISRAVMEEEKGMEIVMSEPVTTPDSALDENSTMAVIRLFKNLPHGVLTLSETVPGLVQTSTNLAQVNLDVDQVKVEIMTRSSVDVELESLRGIIQKAGEDEGATVEQLRPYPGWPARPDSPINKIASEAWEEISGQKLKIIAIHAGLECGIIIGKYPHLEAISIGPTIKDPHSTEERVNIESVRQFYALIKNLVSRISE